MELPKTTLEQCLMYTALTMSLTTEYGITAEFLPNFVSKYLESHSTNHDRALRLGARSVRTEQKQKQQVRKPVDDPRPATLKACVCEVIGSESITLSEILERLEQRGWQGNASHPRSALNTLICNDKGQYIRRTAPATYTTTARARKEFGIKLTVVAPESVKGRRTKRAKKSDVEGTPDPFVKVVKGREYPRLRDVIAELIQAKGPMTARNIHEALKKSGKLRPNYHSPLESVHAALKDNSDKSRTEKTKKNPIFLSDPKTHEWSLNKNRLRLVSPKTAPVQQAASA